MRRGERSSPEALCRRRVGPVNVFAGLRCAGVDSIFYLADCCRESFVLRAGRVREGGDCARACVCAAGPSVWGFDESGSVVLLDLCA